MNQMSFQTPVLTKVNKGIIFLYVTVFLLSSILKLSTNISLLHLLGLSFGMVKKGLILQVITYPFIDVDFISVLFNSLIIWFIGADLERNWGTKFYLSYLGIIVIGTAFFFLSLSFFTGNEGMPLYGVTGMTYGMLLAYGIIYSERLMTFMLIFPMKAKYFCLLLVGIQLYMGVFTTQRYSALSHLMAMLIGFIYLRYKSYLAQRNKEMPRKRMKNNAGLYIVKEDQPKADPNNPKYWQ